MDKHLSEKGRRIDSRDEKGSRRRGLSRAVKAVLFHTKLSRRNQGSKMGSGDGSWFAKSNPDFDSEVGLMKSSSLSFTSSSCLSSQTSGRSTSISSPIPNLKRPKQKQVSHSERSSGSIIMGFLLILISLALTILWGKIWAIALNAVWLYWIPQNGSSGRREKSVGVKKTESRVEQRRRVIMEGLLDRKHYHYHHHRTWQRQ
uniref:Transmembrane protein n=1 Tax=Kalanchoe fedtschenkoi TaxID=63787 RepID=A0A7N0TBT0_KALFE